jgi:uncharacterized repeat protein (TIGR01451 family)
MATLRNRSSLFFLFLFSLSFSLQAQQHPFFGRNGKPVKISKSSKTFMNARVTGTTGTDSVGFGGEPGVVWERMIKEVFPESTSDYTYNVIRLADGAFAISGSIDTDSVNNLDGFIIKVNADGQVLWKKRLGVRAEDFYPSICATTDGGLVATGPFSIDSSFDVPVVKFSSSGAIEWQIKLASGINHWGVDVKLTTDGGYIIVTDKDIYINDTCTSVINDYVYSYNVIIKLNNSGQIVWSKNHFLGRKSASAGDNQEKKITVSSDGYLIANNLDVVDSISTCMFKNKFSDLILMKVNNDGDLVWVKKYGGSQDDYAYDIKRLPNSNFLLLGSTNSVDGDLQGIHADSSTNVAWKMIINDTGKIINNQVYYNNKSGFFYKGLINSDSSYMIVGISDTTDSTGGYYYDSYILKMTKDGLEQWRAIYSNKGITAIDSVNKNEWIFTDIGKDSERGSFGRLGATATITGSVYYDFNKNNIKEANEPYANKFLVTSEKTGYSRSSVATNGWFRNDVDTGTYKTTVKLSNAYYVSVPAEKQTLFTSLFQNDTVHFALQPVAGKRDVSISLIPVTPARPGFNAKYKLSFRNNGTDTIPNGGLLFIKDSRVTLISSAPAAGLVTGDSLLWAYAGLKPFDSYTIDIEVKLSAPPTLNNGDTLRYKAFINSTTGSSAAIDLTPLDDTAHIAQVVVGSYDPNDKQENVAGKIPLAKVAIGEDIQYLIRFQNTGTDTAFTVRITDTLDVKLNWNSLQMISSSHSYKMTVVDGNKISWTFPNINLPDSNVNEPLSQGYIAFRIKAKSNLTAGEYFQNKASIYFDYNLPVETNRTTTVVSTAIITNVRNLSNDDIQLLVLPNPTSGNFYLKLNGRLTGKFECSIIDLYGRVIQTQVIERGSGQDVQLIPLHLERVSTGVYHVILRQKDKIWQQRIMVQ